MATCKGETTNGGVTVDVIGDHWDGTGLDVQTRNGGIRLTSAERLLRRARNRHDPWRHQHRLPDHDSGTNPQPSDTTLGSGGPKLRAMTTNGGVTIRQR